MRGFVGTVAAVLIGLVPGAWAGDWQVPERGSALRRDLMDALRPVVEWELGAPVEFYVQDIRVKGNRAFASLGAQRPGGGEIDLAHTPMAERGDFDVELADVGAGVQAFWLKSGNMWVAVQWAVAATDVWYQWEPICKIWGDLVPEACSQM